MALQALLRRAGCEVHYRSLNAALGLSFMTSVRDPGRCLASWMAEGRDALLGRTAPRFGIRLRELHPPDAAAGLEDAPEFAQHFEASYKPLIKRMLEHDQPVLVSGGWPGKSSGQWGIIASVCDEGIGLSGTTLGSGSELVPLAAPPVQAYVVEEVAPHVPSDDELFRLVVCNACVVVQNRTDPRFGTTTGPGVYDSWLERLRHKHVCATCRGRGAGCHKRTASAVTLARESAVEFLSHHRDALSGPPRHNVDKLIAECKGVIQALGLSCDLSAVQQLLESEDGRAKLARDVELAHTHETAIRDYLGQLSEMLEK